MILIRTDLEKFSKIVVLRGGFVLVFATLYSRDFEESPRTLRGRKHEASAALTAFDSLLRRRGEVSERLGSG